MRVLPSDDSMQEGTLLATGPRTNRLREGIALVLVCLLMVGVFVFDIYTPPDDVSICFIYAVLILLSGFSYRHTPYICAGLATALSWLGAFIQTPSDSLSLVFFGNRAIAVVAQWLVAFLVVLRRDVELRMRSEYEKERANAETSRRFVDVITHEIGTSLTTIDGQAFRLKKLISSDETDDAPQRADKIRQAVRHIENVLRQVQIASEIEQGRVGLERSAVNVADIIADAVLELSGGRVIHIDTKTLPKSVHGNADMLQQVVANLLSNAIKYSSSDTAVSIWGRTVDDTAVVSVSDRGRGIPADELEKLFDPYFRASNSRSVHGTGIGLYVVQRYIQNHGGSIDITSDLGQGTTVTFQVPIGVHGSHP